MHIYITCSLVIITVCSDTMLILAFIITVFSLGGFRTFHSYRRFLGRGPGGTPSTFPGFLKVSTLAVFAHRNRTSAPRTYTAVPNTQHLSALPYRGCKRPIVEGPAPQRQTNQQSPTDIQDKITAKMHELASQNAGCRVALSEVEPHSTALVYYGFEVAHLHKIDGSMHVFLSLCDSDMVIRAGWGGISHVLTFGSGC